MICVFVVPCFFHRAALFVCPLLATCSVSFCLLGCCFACSFYALLFIVFFVLTSFVCSVLFVIVCPGQLCCWLCCVVVIRAGRVCVFFVCLDLYMLFVFVGYVACCVELCVVA